VAVEYEAAVLAVLLNSPASLGNLVHSVTDLQAANLHFKLQATDRLITVAVVEAALDKQEFEEAHLQGLILFQENRGAAVETEEQVLSQGHFLLEGVGVDTIMKVLE
jgi:hypothetical protein